MWHILRHHRNISLVGDTITLRVFVPEPSTFVCMASGARSSRRRPCTLLRTEPPPHRRPLLPSSPKPTGARYPGAAFSIPRCAPIESAQSDESWSCRRANSFRSSASLVVGMQLVCQRNSLNRRGVTAQEIAEPSEIPDCSVKQRRNAHCHSLM